MRQLLLYINFKKNNIIITLSESREEVSKYKLKTLVTISSGSLGFKNKQKKTPFACISIIRKIMINKPISIIFKGESFFKNLILDLLKKENIKIISIYEKTNISYNGCKYSYKKRNIINEFKK